MSDSRTIKRMLKDGVPTVGSWMQIPDADVAEILADAGYDWIALDLEHGLFAPNQLADIFRALELHGTVPMARVAEAEMKDIKHALEAGARGIILPMIESGDALTQAIAWARYAPQGIRGVGFSRANLYGKHFDRCFADFNDSVIAVAQIENIRALISLESILSVRGLDAIMIGPYDLSSSMGLTGKFDDPEFVRVVQEIQDSARRAGVACGIHVVQPDPEVLSRRIQEGYTWIAYGTDAIFLNSSCQRPRAGMDLRRLDL